MQKYILKKKLGNQTVDGNQWLPLCVCVCVCVCVYKQNCIVMPPPSNIMEVKKNILI